MIIQPERWLLDTNVWVFGLRGDDASPACAQLLDRVGSFSVVIPLQVLKELHLALTEDEMRDFYRLTNQCAEFIELSWEQAAIERVKFYEGLGCRKGDAVIAAHAEALGVKSLLVKTVSSCKRSGIYQSTFLLPPKLRRASHVYKLKGHGKDRATLGGNQDATS